MKQELFTDETWNEFWWNMKWLNFKKLKNDNFLEFSAGYGGAFDFLFFKISIVILCLPSMYRKFLYHFSMSISMSRNSA